MLYWAVRATVCQPIFIVKLSGIFTRKRSIFKTKYTYYKKEIIKKEFKKPVGKIMHNAMDGM